MDVRCVMPFLNLTLLKMQRLSVLGPQRRDIEEANANLPESCSLILQLMDKNKGI